MLQMVRKQVSFQERKKENAPKFPSIKIYVKQPSDATYDLFEFFRTFLLNNLSRLLKMYMFLVSDFQQQV